MFCCLAIVRSELATARDIPATAKTHKSKCCNRAAAAWFASEDGQKWGAERRRLLHHGEPDAIISTRSSRVIAGANGTAKGSRAAELAGSASSAPSAPPSASRIAVACPLAPTPLGSAVAVAVAVAVAAAEMPRPAVVVAVVAGEMPRLAVAAVETPQLAVVVLRARVAE